MNEIPVESRTLNYVLSKGWEFKRSGIDQIVLQKCLFCTNDNFKLYLNVGGDKKDGLWDCKVCSAAGNLYKLMESQGDKLQGVVSLKDGVTPAPLPNVGTLHERLMQDEDALDYLISTRGFSTTVIEKYKLGVDERDGIKWLVIPYLLRGNPIFVKYRSLPPAEKAFRAVAGREAPLFNEESIVDGMEELLFVEGESDCLSCLSNGIEYVVGVPGANVKKATWINKVTQANPKKIYILYDNDKVGQKAAKEIAKRIGIERCFNILLPDFTTSEGTQGKDINEWFRSGHSIESFNTLKEQARPFDVDGVTSLGAALQELDDDIERGGSLQPTLVTQYPSLNRKLGGLEWGDMVGIIAEGKIGKTTMCMNLLDFWVFSGYPCLMYCLEMSPKRLARKWCSYITHTDDSPGRSQITRETIKNAKEIAATREADFLFALSASEKETVFETIRQAVRLYGVKIVCFDYLQQLCFSIDNSAQEIAVLVKEFKDLAMELGIVILLVVQPNRVQEGTIVRARNALGSSAIEKAVDSMIALHRNRIGGIKASEFIGFLDTESTFEPQMLCNVDLNRYGSGGQCTLWMDGHISTVREFNADELDNVPKPSYNGEVPLEQPQEV
jgi:twinkle protein